MSDELKPCPCCGSTHLETTENVNESNNLGRCGAVWCECGLHMSARSLEEAMTRWNARAAVTDEQFAVAVHDGRAWEPVRTCGEWRGDLNPEAISDFAAHEGYELWCEYCDIELEPDWAYCPNCGAKVAG